jgi:ribosome maturation factor RimP
LFEVAQGTTLEKIERIVLPILADLGMELVELEYQKEGREWVVRIFLDKVGGVNLDDCAIASREVGTVLEVEDVVSEAYRLEVSSPGLDRPLKKAADFQRFVGELAKIKTFEKMDPDGRGQERKTFVGRLLGFEEGRVRIQQLDKKGGEVSFALEEIAKANLEPEF